MKVRLNNTSRLLGAATAAVVICLALSEARADSVVLGPTRDNTLYESASGSVSNGAGEHLFAGTTNRGNKRRALLDFDIAGNIPAGSVITSASLSLNMSQTIAGAVRVNLHRVLLSWGEGASDASGSEGGGAPSEPGDATWIHTFFSNQLWATAGGDFLQNPSAFNDVDQVGGYGWSSVAMVADVQSWLDDPQFNWGWILVADETALTTAKRFDSRENIDPLVRPTLFIQYTSPTSAAGHVPDGLWVPGLELTVKKTPSLDLILSWGPSCRPADSDYEVYEGTLGSFYNHLNKLCSTGGLTQATLTPSPGNEYYLVVSRNASHEGSYGYTSIAAEIPQSTSPCLPQSIAGCQ